MSIFKKRLKIGSRVAAITYSLGERNCEFKIGKIVAIREKEDDSAYDFRTYVVRFDDGKIDLFSARQLFTEWEK